MHQIPQADQRVIAADRAFAGLVRAGRAHHRADHGDRVRAFEDGRHDRRRRDHSDEIVVEELSLVDGVMLLRHRAVHLQKTKRGEAQSAFLETREDFEGDPPLQRVGFQHDERALRAHDAITTGVSSAAEGAIAPSDARGPIAATYESSGRRYSRATRCMSAGVTPSMSAETSSTERTRPRKSS